MRPSLMAILFACLACARACAEPVYQPPGKLVPVFDTHLHLFCLGSGTPAVLFEAGLGGNHLDWWRVQPLVARRNLACSYDRAGAGFSDRTGRPRDGATIAGELHELVRVADIPRPFVLVGHSLGGVFSLLYAKTYPADVAALVLLDSMHPDQFARFADAGVHIDRDPHSVLGHTPAIAAAYGMPESGRREAIDLAIADKARVFVYREMAATDTTLRELRDAGWPRTPGRVLVHGDGEWNAVTPDGSMERAWSKMQDEIAAGIGAPPPLVIAGSGHQIALDQPSAVSDAVRAVSVPRSASRAH